MTLQANALRDFTSKLEFDYIINCAAFVGGIAYGYKYPAEMLVVNSRIVIMHIKWQRKSLNVDKSNTNCSSQKIKSIQKSFDSHLMIHLFK